MSESESESGGEGAREGARTFGHCQCIFALRAAPTYSATDRARESLKPAQVLAWILTFWPGHGKLARQLGRPECITRVGCKGLLRRQPFGTAMSSSG